jgi:alanine or glycine:cation symporter, AGCS family
MGEQLTHFFETVSIIDDFFWSYVGVPALMGLGLYFSIASGWFQIVCFPAIIKRFSHLLGAHDEKLRGIPPMQAFFASIAGSIGIGNLVAVCTAVKIGGPGAVFWMWIAALMGMLVKYAEIYLGVRYRVRNQRDSYDGGPMIYLQRAFGHPWIAKLFCVFLFVYGVEIYMFRVVTHSVATSLQIDYSLVVVMMLAAVLFAGRRGVQFVGKLSSIVIPTFLVLFISMGCWILFSNMSVLPDVFAMIFTSAFTGHAALGAFAGSGVLMGISQGVKRACYSSDLGIGYAAIIHSETEEVFPERQAMLGVVGTFVDTFVMCTMSVLLILVSGVWQQDIGVDRAVVSVLATYFPYIELVWPFIILLLGYSSIIAFFSAGRKAAYFLSPKHGSRLFSAYAFCAFLLFSYIGNDDYSLMVMSVSGVCLLAINVAGMIKLRKDINFEFR